jgi:hypothetical protein
LLEDGGRLEPWLENLSRFHVSPSENRQSIWKHGLDWRRMNASLPGIANGRTGRPEEEGIYLTDPRIEDARFFVEMGRRSGRSIDVWRVDVEGLEVEDLSDEGGWWICRTPISPERLTLVEAWDERGEPVPVPSLHRRRSERRRSRRRAR